MHRHSPLMRSLLSQSQTPTTPRRAVGFFRFGWPLGLPRWADHPAYFGLTKVLLSQSFRPSTGANVNSCLRVVNAPFQCNRRMRRACAEQAQPLEQLTLIESES